MGPTQNFNFHTILNSTALIPRSESYIVWPPVTRSGYNAIYVVLLWGTTAITQFAFGFSTWKFYFLYSLLLQRH